MSFEKIFDAITELGKPRTGDLVLFRIEDGVWTAALHPLLGQKFTGKDYDDVVQKALEYAADWSKRGREVSIWKEIDANKEEYSKVL